MRAAARRSHDIVASHTDRANRRQADLTVGDRCCQFLHANGYRQGRKMELDTQKIDDAILALLYLGLHDGARAWKGFDWDAMDRLHEHGYITDPRSRAKSVVFTKKGLERARRLLTELFGKQGEPNPEAERDRPSRFARH
jgi:hypothetical protein